ncbi:MAG: GGDEF domain-containing protein, partial [Gammaproteobacteria bacterium]|nr:GGDEF domain-containing protein [Gammaproteobacteria bacterium]
VANRAGLDLALERELGLGRRQGLPLSALLFDVDKFKHINDRFGHAVGDQVLGALAKEVQESIRSSDILARTGGEEFVLVLPGTDSDGAALLAERLCQRIAALRCEILSGDRKERIGFTVSVGAATWNGQEDAGALIHRADLAMYSAKQLGGNRIGVAETLVAAS